MVQMLLLHASLEIAPSLGRDRFFIFPSCPGLVCSSSKVKQILGSSFPFPLDNKKVDLPELQGEPHDISREKCRLAAEQVRRCWLHEVEYYSSGSLRATWLHGIQQQ